MNSTESQPQILSVRLPTSPCLASSELLSSLEKKVKQTWAQVENIRVYCGNWRENKKNNLYLVQALLPLGPLVLAQWGPLEVLHLLPVEEGHKTLMLHWEAEQYLVDKLKYNIIDLWNYHEIPLKQTHWLDFSTFKSFGDKLLNITQIAPF